MRESGERSSEEFFRNSLAAGEFALRKQQQQMNLAQGALGLQQQEQSLELGRVKLQGLSQDTEDIPKWLSEHPTEESRRSAAWPVARTPEWERNLNQLRIADSRSVSQKAAVEDVSLFNKRLAALTDAGSRAAIKGMTANKDGTPSAIQWQALGYAEDAARIAAQNQKESTDLQSEIDRQQAIAKGDKVVTTTGPKGTTTSISTVPKTSDFTPQSPMVFSDGSKLIHVSPQRWQFVKGDKVRNMTSGQLKDYATTVLKEGDPLREQIMGKLRADVEKQVGADQSKDVNGLPPKPDAGTAPAMPKISTKAERDALAPGTQYIGPDGKTYTRQ